MSIRQERFFTADEARADGRRVERRAKRGRRRETLSHEDVRKFAMHLAFTERYCTEYGAAAILSKIFSPFPLSVALIERSGRAILRIEADFQARPVGPCPPYPAAVRTAAQTFINRRQAQLARCRLTEHIKIIDETEWVLSVIDALKCAARDDVVLHLARRPEWIETVRFLVHRAQLVDLSELSEQSPLSAQIAMLLDAAREVVARADAELQSRASELPDGILKASPTATKPVKVEVEIDVSE